MVFRGRRATLLMLASASLILMLFFINGYLFSSTPESDPGGAEGDRRRTLKLADQDRLQAHLPSAQLAEDAWLPAGLPGTAADDTACDASRLTADQRGRCFERMTVRVQREVEQLRQKMEAMVRQRPYKSYPVVRFRPFKDRMRILVTGGAGFVGSHLVDRLMLDGHDVTVVDNLHTGRKRNVEHWLGHENFQLDIHDIVNTYYAEVDQIYHLASPASPPHYMANPVKTIKTNTIGTINMLGLAKRVGAKILIASTSEVYGDPEVHPQPETYWGHVNPIGPRACYDEAKRLAETLAFAYNKQSNVSVRVARIFNTYGPRMHNNDGRVVSNFVLQALQNKTLTVYGSGQQTRSFQYVSDLVEGLVALMQSDHSGPVNLGNPVEHSINEFAHIIMQTVGGSSQIEYLDAVEDDPQKRKPDIKLAKQLLGWAPKVPLSTGIPKTAAFFKQELDRTGHNDRNHYDPLIDWSHVVADHVPSAADQAETLDQASSYGAALRP